VSAVAELAARVDPFEVHLLQGFARCVHEHGFAECDDAFFYARDAALEKEEVVGDGAVADEASHTVMLC